MAQRITTHVVTRKRWFFWPALILLCALGKLGLIRNPAKAGKWLADHAMRIEVR